MIREFGLPPDIQTDNLLHSQMACLMAITAVAPATEQLQLKYLYDMQKAEINEKNWVAEVERAEVSQNRDLLATVAMNRGLSVEELLEEKADDMRKAALQDLKASFPTLFPQDEARETRDAIIDKAERMAQLSAQSESYRERFAKLRKEHAGG